MRRHRQRQSWWWQLSEDVQLEVVRTVRVWGVVLLMGWWSSPALAQLATTIAKAAQ